MNDAATSPHASWFKRARATVVWALMTALYGFTGWWFAAKPISVALGNWHIAADYQAVQGTVITQTAKDREGNGYQWRAARYDVAGKSYVADRYTVLDDDDIDVPANAAVAKQLEVAQRDQQPVTVWVSPRKPEIGVLSRDLPTAALLPRVPMALAFGLIALAGLAGTLGALPNLPYYRNLHSAAGAWGFSAAWCGFIMPMLMIVGDQPRVETIALVFVGLFALIGLLVIWSAVSMTLKGNGRDFFKPAHTPSHSSRKTQTIKGKVKRGGMGGRGSDFDKD